VLAGVFKLFVLVPVITAAVVFHLFTSDSWLLTLTVGVVLYFPIHQFGQAIGLHKLFAHKSFKPVSWYPLAAALVGSISFFGDPLASAMTHRLHHKYSDTALDPHSPTVGRFHAYMGWVVAWRPSTKDALIISDLVREYPWMVGYRRIEWAIPVVFHGAMFIFAGWLFYPVALACVLSIQNGLLLNAFSHNPRILGKNKAIDSPLLAALVNPIFLHRRHHDKGDLMDYSNGAVRDFGAFVIQRFLQKKYDKSTGEKR
jgi:fatty-acid desaturase